MNPLFNTRIMHAEHSYPQPTRNHLSQQQRERAKRSYAGSTQASEVRFGIRLPSGATVMDAETASQRLARLQDEKAVRDEIIARTKTDAYAAMAEIDTWAKKS